MAGEADIISGVASGASAGASFGPWGAVIGGVIGGVGGLLAGNSKKKAKKYVRKANALREQTYRLRSFAEQRNLLRQGQVQAAAAIAGATTTGADVSSSGFQGVNASVWKQMLDNYMVGEEILGQQLQANVYDAKAGKAVARADTIGDILGAGAVLSQAIPRAAPRTNDPGMADVLAGMRLPSEVATTYPTEGPGARPAPSLIYSPQGN